MRYVAAYLLATLGGKASPSQNDIEKILSSVGIEADTEKLKKVISELNGKTVDELIAQEIMITIIILFMPQFMELISSFDVTVFQIVQTKRCTILPGMEKLLSMPVGGAVAVSTDAAPAGGAAAPAEEKK
ncbi:unnamed protein product, partial [Heterotrigona itama]